MDELTTNISWLAVVTGAIAAFLVGWLWYSPMLFGKKWAEGVGVELGAANDMPMAAMVLQAIGLLLMSWFVAVTATNNALLTVILATLAFTVMGMAGGKFARHSEYATNVNAGFWIVSLALMVVANVIF